VTEFGDAGSGPSEVDRTGQGGLPGDQFDVVAERVVEGDEVAHMPLAGLFVGTAPHRTAELLQLRFGGLEGGIVQQREGRRVDSGLRTLHQRQAMVTMIGTQVGHPGLLQHWIQAHDVRREPRRTFQIGDPGTHVGDVLQFDHLGPLW
jgi:hypothetical protein